MIEFPSLKLNGSAMTCGQNARGPITLFHFSMGQISRTYSIPILRLHTKLANIHLILLIFYIHIYSISSCNYSFSLQFLQSLFHWVSESLLLHRRLWRFPWAPLRPFHDPPPPHSVVSRCRRLRFHSLSNHHVRGLLFP